MSNKDLAFKKLNVTFKSVEREDLPGLISDALCDDGQRYNEFAPLLSDDAAMTLLYPLVEMYNLSGLNDKVYAINESAMVDSSYLTGDVLRSIHVFLLSVHAKDISFAFES